MPLSLAKRIAYHIVNIKKNKFRGYKKRGYGSRFGGYKRFYRKKTGGFGRFKRGFFGRY
jgi:hypothetical protein